MDLRMVACASGGLVLVACSHVHPTDGPTASASVARPASPASPAPSASFAPSAVASSAPTSDAKPATLDALARAIASSRDLADATTHVRPLAASMGASYTADGTTGFTVRFASPLEAHEVAHAFGVARPHAVSGDVHQHSWRMVERGEDVPDAHQKRIATTLPKAGAWSLDIALDERPAGPLPNVVAGASPAYDLLHITARVVSIRAGTD